MSGHFRVVDLTESAKKVSKQLNKYAAEGYLLSVIAGKKGIMVKPQAIEKSEVDQLFAQTDWGNAPGSGGSC